MENVFVKLILRENERKNVCCGQLIGHHEGLKAQANSLLCPHARDRANTRS